ncbi:hypothetical protein CLF_105588 [Clonorchis sinensis]|uniref:Uncharacterized protein n=1 Tax=Clonorchis sinensis TaxID=79923 RepID=G7YDR9_CLOSI|nr:hypothetical protein CLF_105588 [Clonorchis sinensis]
MAVSFVIRSLHDGYVVDVDCANTVGSLLIAKAPTPDDLLLSKWTHITDVQPAGIPGNNVSILMGTSDVGACWVIEQSTGSPKWPHSYLTALGWAIFGPAPPAGTKRISVNFLNTEPSVEDYILRSFESDFNKSKGTAKSLSLENKEVMKDTEQSVSSLDGHYQVPLPLANRLEEPTY